MWRVDHIRNEILPHKIDWDRLCAKDFHINEFCSSFFFVRVVVLFSIRCSANYTRKKYWTKPKKRKKKWSNNKYINHIEIQIAETKKRPKKRKKRKEKKKNQIQSQTFKTRTMWKESNGFTHRNCYCSMLNFKKMKMNEKHPL